MNNLSIIVAVAKHNAIGYQNKLLCYLKSDLIRFKQITTGHTIIMGENTYKSLPIFPLPKRKNIVITLDKNLKIDGAEIVYSIDEALELIKKEDEVFVIGGASIYKQFLPYTNKVYLTKINKEFEADTFFPELNHEWKMIHQELGFLDNEIEYDFEIYQR